MEFLQNHSTVNTSEPPYTLGTGSVGSIEATIPSGLCTGPLGVVLSNEDALADGQNEEALGALRLQDLQNPSDDITTDQNGQIPHSGQGQPIGDYGTSFWVDDMADLSSYDLGSPPQALFSPQSVAYNTWVPRCPMNGEGPNDVAMPLKQAVVHPASPTNGYYTNVTNGTPAYPYTQDYGTNLGQFGPYSTGPPSMSVTVMSMNVPHGYEPSYQPARGVDPLLSPSQQGYSIESPTWVTHPTTNGLIVSTSQPHSHHPQAHGHPRLQATPVGGAGGEHALRVAAAGNGGRQVSSIHITTSDNNGRPNVCALCGKSYARPSTLKTHLRTHTGDKPFSCHACSKAFSQAANLTAHARTHSGEKPFRCPVCERKFSQSSSVTTHLRTHSGDRPYKCQTCNKAFSDSSTLTKHLRIHTGEKPYQCQQCFLKFSQSGNLNRHKKIHGNNVGT